MKGICFKEPLFHATIDGRKTQTRRLVKSPTGFFRVQRRGVITKIWDGLVGDYSVPVQPRYEVGEAVYLKEPYNDTASQYRTLYKFDNDVEGFGKGFWSNKLFMPSDLARYLIRITAVRAERLQEISDADCMREGIVVVNYGLFFHGEGGDEVGYHWEDNAYYPYSTPRYAYAALIDNINGRGTWESNPYVWVYDYELLKNR